MVHVMPESDKLGCYIAVAICRLFCNAYRKGVWFIVVQMLHKVLCGEALSRSPTTYPFVDHFHRKGTPFAYLSLKNGTPFTYFLAHILNKLPKKEAFLSFPCSASPFP